MSSVVDPLLLKVALALMGVCAFCGVLTALVAYTPIGLIGAAMWGAMMKATTMIVKKRSLAKLVTFIIMVIILIATAYIAVFGALLALALGLV